MMSNEEITFGLRSSWMEQHVRSEEKVEKGGDCMGS